MQPKHLINKIILIFFIACLFLRNGYALTAEEILAKVEEKYAGLSTYQDKGSVKQEKGIVKFETYFSSPDFFLFKWETVEKFYFPELKKSSIISTKSAIKSNKEATDIFFYYDGDLKSEVKTFSSLESAIPSATGISWGSVFYIPSLIFQRINKSKLTNLREAKVVGVQNTDGKDCYIITGKWLRVGTKYKIWIEKDSFIIKKFIRDNSDIYSFGEVIINKRIPSSILEFRP